MAKDEIKRLLEKSQKTLEKEYGVGAEIEGKISSINEYAIYLKIENISQYKFDVRGQRVEEAILNIEKLI